MFDALTDRLQGVMQSLKGHGKLTAEDVDAAMREIRLALLEADVNFKVVREFVAHIKERALGESINVPVYAPGADVDPVDIARDGVKYAREHGDVAIVDTAGRLHVDDELMGELVRIRDAVQPHNVLLVVDAMTGQDAVNAADEFRKRVDLDGVVLTKLDGDARGGAALSVRAVTGKPIKFASTGEKLGDFDVFHPDRMASRILGMGDVLSLIEKAGEAVDEKQAAEMEAKLRRAEFTFEDFLDQLKQVRKMGSLSSILGMLPGVPGMKELKNVQVELAVVD